MRRRPTTEEVQQKRLKGNSSSTIKCNNKAVIILREYLKEMGQVSNFESFDPEQLNEVLGHFILMLENLMESSIKQPL